MSETNIRNIIRQLSHDHDTVNSGIIATVKAVDMQKRTIDAEPLDGSAPLLDINLQANQGSNFGVVVYPKVGSYVIVGPTCGSRAFVVWTTDEIDRVEVKIGGTSVEADGDGIIFNGGERGGLVKINELTQKLNGLVNIVNNFINIYNNHTHVCTSPGSTSATPLPMQADSAETFNKNDYENKLIKQ